MKKDVSKNPQEEKGNQNLTKVAKKTVVLDRDAVKAVINEFEHESEEKGLESAVRSFGVSRVVKELEEVARFRRKNGIELEDMLRGARVARILKEHGVGIPELEVFLSIAYSKALEKGYTPETLVSQVTALNDLEKKHGATFDELKSQYDTIADEIRTMQNERSALNEEVAEIERRKEQAVQEIRAHEQKLEKYMAIKQKLDEMNLNLEQVDKLLKLVQKISSENGMEPAVAYTRFEEDILANYDAVQGLKADIIRLKEEGRQVTDQANRERQQLESEKSNHLEKLKDIDEAYSKVASEIRAFNDLKEKQVDVDRILSWNEILKSAGVDLPTFESKLKNYASLKNLEKEVNQKVVELMSEAASLKESISKLKSGKTHD